MSTVQTAIVVIVLALGTSADLVPGPDPESGTPLLLGQQEAAPPVIHWYHDPIFYQLMLLQLAATLVTAPQAPQLGARATRLGLHSSTMGLVLAPLPLTSTLLSPWIGLHLSALGLRRTLLLGSAAMAASGTAFGLLGAISDNHPLFIGVVIALRAVFGAGSAAQSTATTSYWNENSAKFSTIHSVTAACGTVVGMVIPPACTLLDAQFGYAVPFVAFGALSSVIVAWCAASLPNDLTEPVPCSGTREDLAALRQMPRGGAALAVITVHLAVAGLLSVLIPYVFSALHISDFATACVFSGVTAAWSIGSVLSSQLMDGNICGPSPLIRLQSGLGAALLAVLVLVRSPAAAVALLMVGVSFAAASAQNAASNALIVDALRYDSGLVPLATGLKIAGRTFGEAFGNAFGAVLYGASSLPVTAATFAAMSAASLAAFVVAERTPPAAKCETDYVSMAGLEPKCGVLERLWKRWFGSIFERRALQSFYL